MNVYKALGALAAVVAALGALYWMATALDARGYARGVHETESKWQARELKQQADFDSEKERLRKQYADRERGWTAMLNQIDTQHQKEIEDAQKQKDSDVAAARTGAIRLRDQLASCHAAANANRGDSAAKAPFTASVSDGEAGAELSPAATGFLLSEADRADSIVRQLTACQAVVRADRSR